MKRGQGPYRVIKKKGVCGRQRWRIKRFDEKKRRVGIKRSVKKEEKVEEMEGGEVSGEERRGEKGKREES